MRSAGAGACLAWAALHLLIGLPMNRLLVPKARLPTRWQRARRQSAPSSVPWAMIVLAFVFAGGWFVSTAMAAHLPRLLQALGATPAAAVCRRGPGRAGASGGAACGVQHFAPCLADDLGAARDWPASDCRRASGACRRAGGYSLRAAAWRRQRLAHHRSRHAAARPVRRMLVMGCAPASSPRPRGFCRVARRCCSAWCWIGPARYWALALPAPSPAPRSWRCFSCRPRRNRLHVRADAPAAR